MIGTMPEAPSIAICCSTFHRHEGLRSLLESLAALELEDPAPAIRVVVTNNDPEDREPERIIGSLGTDYPHPVEYLEESRRGLSFPRNRAIEHVVEADTFLAFIDDDSTAHRDWLQKLVEVQARTGADVVTGPVEPAWESPPEDWLVKGGFFAPAERPTGTRLDRAFTNNVLIRCEAIRRTGARFDPDFALFGSEDTYFTRGMTRQGVVIVWAAEARVDDWVPDARANAQWLVMRHNRTGMCSSVQEIRLSGAAKGVPLQIAKAATWLVLGSGLYLLGLARGRATRVRARCWLAWGRGLVSGMLGRKYEEYLHER